MAKLSVGKTVESLGDYLREQRGLAQMSLRQLAEQSDVSNPYLSQIERGLRRPSAEVLQQIARALKISVESLYVKAGILDAEDTAEGSVEHAIARDARLTDRQRTALIDIYRSFIGDTEGHHELDTAVNAADLTKEGIA
ncbi:MAG TPA: helix-turn-helix transcriptional regulator [Aeromicrobium sp.]|nr:helix-turn-helix transcriptional regulator [Aeromicrobium sp.]